jgi:hypothetical protein
MPSALVPRRAIAFVDVLGGFSMLIPSLPFSAPARGEPRAR